MRERRYNFKDTEFILEPLNPNVVRVRHRNQVGYSGVNQERSHIFPYAFSTSEPMVKGKGVNSVLTCGTPDDALKELCELLLHLQSKEDASTLNPDDGKEGAERALQNFLEELPD